MTKRNKPVREPTTQTFIDALEAKGGKPLYTLPYSDVRKVLEDLQAINVKKLPANIEEKVFPDGPTEEVSVRIYRRPKAKGPLPIVMYFHGGGWVLGSKNTHDRLVRDLVNGSDAALVFVNYTPSPNAQFPVSVEQSYAATKYVSENGKELGLDLSRLALAGESAGGYTTAVVSQLAKERNGPSIRYQVLMYPVTDSSMSQPSYEEFADGPRLTKAEMAWFWDAYAPNEEDRKKTMASPLSATVVQLRGSPPALVIVDEDYDTVFYPGGPVRCGISRRTRCPSLCSNRAFAGVRRHVKYKGAPLVKGKHVTGFTNREEEEVKLTHVVLEDELLRLGAVFEKVPNWQPFSITDGRLITGPSPPSSTSAAQAL